LAVCGGIAAYKAAELVRLLTEQDAEVRVVMTQAAQAFVTPLTFQALSGQPVHSELLDSRAEHAMSHIQLARWADLLLVAPATADVIAKFSQGLADDLLSTLYLAANCPVYIAPAMNQVMWQKTVTQENIQRLQRHGNIILGPATGAQACGDNGPGRMLEAAELCEQLQQHLQSGPCHGVSVLISAGPTREPIDPVRFISNRSSGKMGYALARAVINMGGKVTLVSGPVNIPLPEQVTVINVETAEQMHQAILANAPEHDIYIGAAAVADYAPVEIQSQKIKKNDSVIVLKLSKTRDILAGVAALPDKRPYTVGFAAETNNLEQYALDKLQQKNLDMIAANQVGQQTGGFDNDQNALSVYWPGGHRELGLTDKARLAEQLMVLIMEKFNEKRTTENT